MAITASYDGLMRQASATADEYLRAAIRNIDASLGEGYAAKNPELLAAMIRASASDFNTASLVVAIQEAVPVLAEGIAMSSNT